MAGFFRSIALAWLGKTGDIAVLAGDVSSANDPTAFFCGVIRGGLVERPKALAVEAPCAMAAAANAPVVAVASYQLVRVVDVAKRRVVFEGKKSSVLDLALSDDGATLGVLRRAGESCALESIDLHSGKSRGLTDGDLEGICFASGVFATCVKAGRKYELVGFDRSKRAFAHGLGGSPFGLRRARDANVVVAGIGKKSVAVVDLAAGKVTKTSTHQQKDTYAAIRAASSHDGRTVVARGSDDTRLVVTSGGDTRTRAKVDDLHEPYGTRDTLITTPGFVTDGAAVVTFDGTTVTTLPLV
jgi:hypothetical protein